MRIEVCDFTGCKKQEKQGRKSPTKLPSTHLEKKWGLSCGLFHRNFPSKILRKSRSHRLDVDCPTSEVVALDCLYIILNDCISNDTPLKIHGWNIIPWRFGSDHFPFNSLVICRWTRREFSRVYVKYTCPYTLLGTISYPIPIFLSRWFSEPPVWRDMARFPGGYK